MKDPGKQIALLRFWPRLFLASVCGLILGLGQVPFGFQELAIVGLALGLALVHGATRPGLLGWVFGTSYFALTLHWITEPFMVDAARTAWMAPFALIGLSGGLALFWMLAFRIGAWLRAGPWGVAVALGFAELLRGQVLTGFPWGMIGYMWLDTTTIHWVAWIGSYGLTALTLIAAASIASATMAPMTFLRVAVRAFPLFALLVVGGLRPVEPPSQSQATIRVIQPNAPQHLKWKEDWIPVFFKRQLDLTRAEGAHRPDLVIWPEVAVAYSLEPGAPARAAMLEASGGAPIIVGHLRWDGRKTYNTLSLLRDTDGMAPSHDKHHLVPFGEYIPFGDWLMKFGINGLAANPGAAFSAGPGPNIIDAGPKLGRFLPMICYEAVFPRDARIPGDRPDWLLHLTNDAWFGGNAGPRQHLAQARIRAIEQGLPVIRAANTGISAVIDPYGGIVDSLPLGQAGKIDASLPPSLPSTPYARTGDLPVSVILVLLAALLALRRRRIQIDATGGPT
ncbi:MAG: apolipoprotein N-acyltransferase [Brevirhabdus sp.]